MAKKPWRALLNDALLAARDDVQGLNAGLGRGVVALAGAPGDARSFVDNKIVDAQQALGILNAEEAADERRAAAIRRRMAPTPLVGVSLTSDEIRSSLPKPLQRGLAYQPKTVGGSYMETVGEFAPNAFIPGGVPMKVAAVAVPATASEVAGQMTKGTPAEPYARAIGGMVGAGGMHASAAPTKGRVFWSGGSDVAGAQAARWATENGGVTLERTLPGRALNAVNTGLRKITPMVDNPDLRTASAEEALRLPPKISFADVAMKPAWQAASASFAQGADGPVQVFLNRPRTASVWNTVEEPILRGRNFRTVYDLSEP